MRAHLTPRAADLLRYMTGLAPVGEPFAMPYRMPKAALGIRNSSQVSEWVRVLIDGGFVAHPENKVFVVLRQAEDARP